MDEVHGRASRTARARSKRVVLFVVIAVVVAGVAMAGWFFWAKVYGNTGIDTSKYQAVFFTNGQVYFGKLHPFSGERMRLTDVFYLQTNDQGDQNSKNPQEAATSTDVQLIKLGKEIHGPEDEMIIAKDQILFYENLKPDGKVVSSIKQYADKK